MRSDTILGNFQATVGLPSPVHPGTSTTGTLLTQKGMVIWLLGLSGAGKSTLAKTMAKLLADKGFITVLLDGDDLRSGINKDLTFSESDRLENIRRAAEIAKILVQNNIIVICSFITPLREQRDLARSIIGAGYFEVFVSCPLEVCEQRDVKGLYKKARNKEIIDFTGIQARFDIPSTSDLVITTDRESPEQSAGRIFRGIQDYA